MAERHDDRLREMEERGKELDREIDETEEGWEKTQQEVPTADTEEPEEPLDEDNPVGGV